MSTTCLYLAEPRGFCAGVVRAIEIVERALKKYGAPIYVRHEIVHNKHVVQSLKAKGVVFVQELDEIPEGTLQPVIFSAHGVAKKVPEHARHLNLFAIDATCPLVSKVHREAERFYGESYVLILIGHAGHPEVIGTMGQLPAGSVVLIEKPEDVAHLDFPMDQKLAYVTQTTLSLDDTAATIQSLTAKFPHIVGPKAQDICYATSNRQKAVKDLCQVVDLVLVVGSPNSSNSNRLVEVAQSCGKQAFLIEGPQDLPWDILPAYPNIGLTAGASAPEDLVSSIILAVQERLDAELRHYQVSKEQVVFKLPPI